MLPERSCRPDQLGVNALQGPKPYTALIEVIPERHPERNDSNGPRERRPTARLRSVRPRSDQVRWVLEVGKRAHVVDARKSVGGAQPESDAGGRPNPVESAA